MAIELVDQEKRVREALELFKELHELKASTVEDCVTVIDELIDLVNLLLEDNQSKSEDIMSLQLKVAENAFFFWILNQFIEEQGLDKELKIFEWTVRGESSHQVH